MKRVPYLSILMINIFNLFGFSSKGQNDPYWEFNEKEHFRPQLNKGEFFKLSGFDFGWFVLEPLSKFTKDREHEIERGQAFSYGQKALYYWWYLDAQVTNGGFVQFYYNGYGPYVPTIIKGLEHIGDTEMANLVKKADKIYQKNKKLVDKAQESGDLFGGDLYDRLEGLSALDDDYFEQNKKTMSLLERYIRKNSNEICLDEEGNEFDMSFTGLCTTYYEDKSIKEEFKLEQGVLHGVFKSFYQNGNLKEKIAYLKGIKTGELEEFHDNGKLKYQIKKDSTKTLFIHQWYYDNGHPKKLESKWIDKDEQVGEYKEWYENGQLSEIGTYKSAHEREGKCLEFYQDGSPKVDAEFINGAYLLKNHWNEKGKQILTNGTGLHVYEPAGLSDELIEYFMIEEEETIRHEDEYKDYKRHGKQKTFTNGILTMYQEMQHGKNHGITRNYYSNGHLKEEKIYKHGTVVSTKEFPKFKQRKVKTTIISKLCKACYEGQEEYILPDNEPKPTNDISLADNFKAEVSMFEEYGDDYTLGYSYIVYVDKNGHVKDIKFSSADNMWIADQVQANLKKIVFEKAVKNGVSVESIHFVQHKFHIIE